MSNEMLEPLSRSEANLFYFVEIVIFGFMIYGALQGKLALPTRGAASPLSLYGWAAWAGCFSHLGLIGLTYFRIDPASVCLTVSTRRWLMAVSAAYFLVLLGVASVFGPKS